MLPEPVPFASERTIELRDRLKNLNQITPVLDHPQLVKGWLTANGLSVVYGPSNCGKTFFVSDLAMHVAAGRPWRGRRVAKGNVVYIAAEGGRVIENRFEAMRQAKPELCNHSRFHLLPSAVDLSSVEDVTAICQLLPDCPLALVVVDTLARSIGEGDENSARDMSVFVQNLDQIRERTGAHVLVIHHTGKDADRGARGSSALRAAVDTEIAISADRAVTAPKQRDLATPEPVFFDLEQVVLGVDGDDEQVTSAIVVEADAPSTKRKRLTGRNEVALNALVEALRKDGKRRTGEDFPEGRLTVEVSKWRNEVHLAGLVDPDATTSTKSKAFTRAREALLDADLARFHGDFVWLVSRELEPS